MERKPNFNEQGVLTSGSQVVTSMTFPSFFIYYLVFVNSCYLMNWGWIICGEGRKENIEKQEKRKNSKSNLRGQAFPI